MADLPHNIENSNKDMYEPSLPRSDRELAYSIFKESDDRIPPVTRIVKELKSREYGKTRRQYYQTAILAREMIRYSQGKTLHHEADIEEILKRINKE